MAPLAQDINIALKISDIKWLIVFEHGNVLGDYFAG
jgi:hypothetical protein